MRLPQNWSTWGSFPDPKDKDLYTYNVIWRAFSPDGAYMIEVKWRPEQNPNGSMICNLEVDKDYRNKLYETKPANIKELIIDIQNILDKIPDIYGKLNGNVYQTDDDSDNKRTSLLEASSVVKPREKQKRKYTKRAAKWKNK